MVKGIELHEKQIEATNNGATVFIMKVDNVPDTHEFLEINKFKHLTHDNYTAYFNKKELDFGQSFNRYCILKNLPLQVGQKFFIQEECFYMDGEVYYNNNYTKIGQEQHRLDYDMFNCQLAESRIKGTTISIEVKRVKDLTIKQRDLCFTWQISDAVGNTFSYTWIEYFDSIYGQGTYESNPYVFIVTFEKE